MISGDADRAAGNSPIGLPLAWLGAGSRLPNSGKFRDGDRRPQVRAVRPSSIHRMVRALLPRPVLEGLAELLDEAGGK